MPLKLNRELGKWWKCRKDIDPKLSQWVAVFYLHKFYVGRIVGIELAGE